MGIGLSPISLNRVTHAIHQLPNGQKLSRNLKTIWTNTRNQLDPSDMRVHILTLGNFVLCCLRAGVSLISAKASQGTPQEDYRFRQAVQTVMREFGGFVLTFVFPLKLIQNLTKSKLQAGLGLKFSEQENYSIGHAVTDSVSQVYHALRHKRLPNVVPVGFRMNGDRQIIALNHELPMAKMLSPLVRSLKGASELAKWNTLYKYAPPLIAALPTLLLSGIMLERFSLNRSADIVDAVSDLARERKSAHYAKQLAKGKVAPLLASLPIASPPVNPQNPPLLSPANAFAVNWNPPLGALPLMSLSPNLSPSPSLNPFLAAMPPNSFSLAPSVGRPLI